MNTLTDNTASPSIPAYVRIRDTDPARRDCHPANVIVCRVDAVAEALLRSGWFGCLPDLTAPELQRALFAGERTDGIEHILDIAVEPYTDNVPIPAGAVTLGELDRDGRMFYGATAATIEASGWLREAVTVETGGLQNVDGSYEWLIWAGAVHPDNPLTAAQARQFGEALIAAADELEQLGAEAVGR